MCAMFRSQVDKVLAIEVNAVIVDVIRVFLWNFSIETGGCLAHVSVVAPVGREDDEPLALLIHLDIQHLTHPVFTLRHLRELALLAVVEIEVGMPVAIAFPEDVVLVEVSTVVARISHIFVILLLDEGFYIALQVHFKHTVSLMTALVELESERLAIVIPIGSRHSILALEEVGAFRIDGCLILYIHHHRNAVIQRIARLGILQGGVDGLHLIGGRRLCISHIMFGSRLDEHGGIIFAIIRPTPPRRIVAGIHPVESELSGLGAP